ncbi:hypothetical protein L0B53_18580 (plasmid) [Vibrio sp. SS-MA-C1-2]|uniref:hypothetical protein n=1 Tax=Vibrio sp. SS-MA-C1-2 TaxID=2908646 RepID=UPI001F3C342E|nr:hypothetical protein [Vibrio sp. SS-MA-C1-2]UJF20330.1 hypothetical protein L0B53_18580 [Vibrio sp. SS-MA-C1-2]
MFIKMRFPIDAQELSCLLYSCRHGIIDMELAEKLECDLAFGTRHEINKRRVKYKLHPISHMRDMDMSSFNYFEVGDSIVCTLLLHHQSTESVSSFIHSRRKCKTLDVMITGYGPENKKLELTTTNKVLNELPFEKSSTNFRHKDTLIEKLKKFDKNVSYCFGELFKFVGGSVAALVVFAFFFVQLIDHIDGQTIDVATLDTPSQLESQSQDSKPTGALDEMLETVIKTHELKVE